MNVHGSVVGVLCSVCRDHTNDSLSNLQLQKNQRKFITQPFVRFGDLVETARSHEFGSKADKTISPNILRKQIEEGKTVVPNTTHMTFYLQDITKKTYESNDATIDNTMKNTHLFVVQENYQGMLKLLSLLHHIIKRRESIFISEGRCKIFHRSA